MITYLKQNRLGRATFLPLTSVDGKGGIRTPEALKEKGVIGLANTLVQHEEKYRGVISYLLGRVVVTDTIDNAIALAKKYHHSLSIVTLEGESLRPGGSMTGGAFRNSSNLLGRNREIEDLTVEVDHLKQALIRHRERREEILTAQALLNDDMETVKEKLQQQYLLENTAKINAERAGRQKEESENVFKNLQNESADLDRQIKEVKFQKEQALAEIEAAKQREAEIAEESEAYQSQLDEQIYLESSVNKTFSEVQSGRSEYQTKE